VHRAINAVSEDSVVRLTQELIRLDSTNHPGRARPVAQAILEYACKRGLEAELQALSESRSNVVVRLRGTGTAPTLLYCGHLDTVPIGNTSWRYDPLGGVHADGRVFGRGASDMKSGLAAMLAGMTA
jgi:succinyl-diaminopimelate desuccinylase